MKKKRMVLFSFIIVTFILIVIGSYINNYNLEVQPPSEVWSKEVRLGTALGKNAPVVLKEESKLIVAYANDKKLNLCEVDLQGEILRTKEYNLSEELVNKVLLTNSSNGYILMYNSKNGGDGYLENIRLDKELNEINRETINGTKATCQLDNNNIIVGYDDRVEIINTLESTSIVVPAQNVSMISISSTKTGFLICYMEDDSIFKSITVNEGTVSEPRLVQSIAKNSKITYKGMATSSDDENGYIIFEQYIKGDFHSSRLIEFPMSGGEAKETKPYINNSNFIINSVGAYSENGGAKFYSNFDNLYGKKEIRRGISALIMKDGKVKVEEIVTRTRGVCINPYINEEYISYLTFKEKDIYDVVIASTGDEFKAINNLPRNSEKISALSYTVEGIAYSFVYIIIIGFAWVAVGLVLSGIVTFCDYKLSVKQKKLMYVVVAAITTITKIFVIITMFYGTYAYMLPNVIAPIYIGIIICVLISCIVYSYGYYLYSNEFEGVFIAKFSLSLLIDAVLTLMVYVPLTI
ncbi:MAG: hypothetical protein RR636_13065 [Clostridium sp.]|uniref:hypothetical protein n=1 Tax=Clostridium sp. TaxID=1506 RepID=UPI00305FA70D